jgi:hypothetical protein
MSGWSVSVSPHCWSPGGWSLMSTLEIHTQRADVIDLPERSWHSCE